MNKNEIIIISAARSGTKMLRYILDASSEMSSYPYDANYVWKYGNYGVKHDEINPGAISNHKKEKIRSFFLGLCEREDTQRFLEKSVPNSLRVPFVRSVFPDCKIIHLYRNGLDVSADSRLCWQAPAVSERIQSKEDRQRKLKEFPFTMAWPYLFEYALNYAKKIIFKQDSVDSWGPRYKGIDDDISEKSLIEVCAIQWMKCVEHCCDELEKLENGVDYINIPYEKMACEPEKYFKKIVDFIQISDGEKVIKRGINTVKTDYIDFWETSLSVQEKDLVLNIISNTQERIQKLG